MISDRDYVHVHVVTAFGDDRPELSWWWYPVPREAALGSIERDKHLNPHRRYEIAPYPACLVCGCLARTDKSNRCYQHHAHTPCAIEGCTKGRKFASGIWDDATWVCGIHWREVCPPRSALRRTYNRFFRTARRLGVDKDRWPAALERRYWRFFRGMISRFQRQLETTDEVEQLPAEAMSATMRAQLRQAGLL